MIYWKGCHRNGLDFIVINGLKKYNLLNIKDDYYLYIYDYCCPKGSETIDSNFYNNKNNASNTWNYDLKYESTKKNTIVLESAKYGFGNQNYDEKDEYIVAKGIGHHKSFLKNYQAHLVKRVDYEKNYDKDEHIGLKILKTDESNITEELNIYVLKNLKTGEYNFKCILIKNNTSSNINRKYSKQTEILDVDISILGEKINNFKEYIKSIRLDYGRLELINDINEGWCILDINNSPGGGSLSHRDASSVLELFVKSLV